jgi:hypothetical protein
MEIKMTKQVPVNVKSVNLHLKVRDEFSCTISDQDGETLKEYEGYVPSFMPGQHHGDYVILDIDVDTGMVTNWVTPQPEEMQDFINGEDEN